MGRNNKGCIVVFSAGNDNEEVIYPANSNPGILAVGAMSECGQRKSPTSCDTEDLWGSCFGVTLDVVAPGVLVPTTDRTTNLGYNPTIPIHPWSGGTLIPTDYTNQDYTVWFNGTSAAAPHVSGIAALILAINPAFTGQQIRDIIEKTAQKVGDYTYATTPNRPNGTWNQEMGYGLVNACGAVLEAHKSASTLSGPSVLFCTPTTYQVNYKPMQSTISWTCSSNISKVSAPGPNSYNFQANGNGSGWIQATITTDCGTYSLRKDIWVGKFENTVVTGQAGVCRNTYYTYTAQVPGGHSPSYTYSWTYPSNWTVAQQYQNTIRLLTPSNPNYGTVRVSITNPCGASGYSGITVYPGSGCPLYYSLYPNPASDDVTINIDENPSLDAVSDSIINKIDLAITKDDQPTKYTIRILNNQGILLSTFTRNGKNFKIPLVNLLDGTYFIEVSDGINSGLQQLVVKHN